MAKKKKQSAAERLKEMYDILDETCKHIREKHGDDSVCGLCQYDADHGQYGDANECPGYESEDCFCMKNEIRELCGVPKVREPYDDYEYDPSDWM